MKVWGTEAGAIPLDMASRELIRGDLHKPVFESRGFANEAIDHLDCNTAVFSFFLVCTGN